MAVRTVSVEASVSFEFEIDDDVVSDWDGAKILEVLEKRKDNQPAVYTPDAELNTLLGHLGIELSIENRRIRSIEGWADFPDEAAKGSPYSPFWAIDSVDVSEVHA